jgi:alkylated DNA repair dioxygenase AlkB
MSDFTSGKIVRDVDIAHGTIYHMSGDFQKEFKHGIPAQKKIQGRRVSFTFRKHLK